ncbi:MAG: 4Fe-4S binding protein [Armatimonadetes bacterium]|nr:4Fe-4S binding protein [Armatimonadota bacterium]
MKRSVLVLLIAVVLASAALAAVERFPPPEFESGYRLPQIQTPGARAQLFSYIDIAVLIIVMALTAWMSLRRRSRRDIVVLVIFSLLYFGFYRKGCVCSIGAIQNVALAIGDPAYVLPLVAGAFFVLPLLFTLFFGRVFCAAACPLGAIQDLVLLKPLRVPRWLEVMLGLIPFVILGVAALLAWTDTDFIICRYDPFVAFFRLSGTPVMLGAGAVLLLIGTVIGRPYCRYICPYSALLRICAVFARSAPVITTGECINCNLCANVCPFNAIKPPTPENLMPRRSEGKTLVVVLLILLPVMMALGGWLGYLGSAELARTNYTVRLAERVWAEQQERVEGTTEQSEAFYRLGLPNEGLYLRAAEIRRKFDRGSTVLGAYLGLVIGISLIGTSIRRRRSVYEIDPALCMACGRCYQVCPEQRARQQELQTGDTARE